MNRAIGVLAAASLGLGSPIGAEEPIGLKPSSKWVVDYADEKCRLLRWFGSGEEAAVLIFEQTSPSARFAMTAAGPQLKDFAKAGGIDLRFSDSQAKDKPVAAFAGTMAQRGPAVIITWMDFTVAQDAATQETDQVDPEGGKPGLPEIDLQTADKVSYIEFRERRRAVRFEPGPMRDAIAALNTCTDNLVASWGLDPARLRSAKSALIWTNRRAVVRRIVEKYPAAAAAAGEQGIVSMRVMVDADGTMTSCHIDRLTDNEAIDSPVCRDMKYARFRPAIDAQGQPMPSYYATKIIYMMQ